MKKAQHVVASKRGTMAPRKREKAFGRHRTDTENGLSPRGQSILARSPSPTPEASHQAAVSDLGAHTAERQGSARLAWALLIKNSPVAKSTRPCVLCLGRVLLTDTCATGGNRSCHCWRQRRRTARYKQLQLGHLISVWSSSVASNHRCCGQAPFRRPTMAYCSKGRLCVPLPGSIERMT